MGETIIKGQPLGSTQELIKERVSTDNEGYRFVQWDGPDGFRSFDVTVMGDFVEIGAFFDDQRGTLTIPRGDFERALRKIGLFASPATDDISVIRCQECGQVGKHLALKGALSEGWRTGRTSRLQSRSHWWCPEHQPPLRDRGYEIPASTPEDSAALSSVDENSPASRSRHPAQE